MNPQQGMGIIPTLFGIHQGKAMLLYQIALALLMNVFQRHPCNHTLYESPCFCAGQGGISEPLTAEQQHQVGF